MAWSTSELAELADTTANTIRHYHRLGLLEEPDRRYNGYKQYGVQHLVKLLRIRRLANLGVPLAQVRAVSAAGERTPEALHQVDLDLQQRVEELQKARADIAAITRSHAPADAPAGFEVAAAQLSEPDTSMIHLYSRMYDEEALADLEKMVSADNGSSSADFDRLSEDADSATRTELAARLAPALVRNLLDYPWLADPIPRLSKSEEVAEQTFIAALQALYNPAQLDVLHQTSVIANAQVSATRRSPGPSDTET